MTAEQLESFKIRLLNERHRVAGELNCYEDDDLSANSLDMAGELSDYDPNDPADQGSILYDRERSIAADDNLRRILSKIDRALRKIEEGTYGLSDIDNMPIPLERLDALPYACD